MALCGLALASCGTTKRLDAAADVHALLVAIRDDDRTTFDAHVDRRALQTQLEARLVAEARSAAPSGDLAEFAAAFAGPLAQLGGDVLLRPRVFREAAVLLGYDPAKPLPGTVRIAAALRYLPDGRVCAPRDKDGPCLLTFSQTPEGWKLTSFDGSVADLGG